MGGDIFHIIDFDMTKFLNADRDLDQKNITNKNDNKIDIIDNNSIFIHKNNKNELMLRNSQEKNDIYASIDNDHGLLIIHPDMLIPPTKIAEAIGCLRRGVISDRVKSLRGGFNKSAVLGNLRHAFIEVNKYWNI